MRLNLKRINVNHIIALSLLFCISLFLVNLFHIWIDDTIDDFTDTVSIVFEFMIMIIAYKVYKNNIAEYDKKLFLWLLLSTIASFIGGLLCHIYYYGYDKLGLLSFFIPYIFWIIALVIFLLKILVPHILKIKSLFFTLCFFIIFNLIIIGLFFLSKSQYLSHLSGPLISLDFSCLCELILFDLAILCLVCSEEPGMQFILSGIPVILSSAFLFNYAYVDQTNAALSESISTYAAIIWLLGLVLIFSGLLIIGKIKNYELITHFRKTNTIKSRLVFWTFSISIGSFLIFFVAAYYFNLLSQVVLAGLPFFITSYSVVVVTLSMFMGKRFEAPFRKLASNVEVFMLNKNKTKIEDTFPIAEFEFLQKFILNMFQINEEKDQAKKELGIIAAQVAHDIRSPTSAILMLAKERTELPEEQRVSLREAANRIQDIANNLILQARSGVENPHAKNIYLFLVSTALLSVIAEKKLQYRDSNIKITPDFDHEAMFDFIKGGLSEFKRVISNLLNNAIQAMQETGEVFIQLLPGNNETIEINIVDSGRGMPKEVIDKILSGQVVSRKTDGLGLGFSHARTFLSSTDGKLSIASELNKGTVVSLTFPKQPIPSWVANEIDFYLDSIIVILDDDSSIHGAWDIVFADVVRKNAEIQIVHFIKANECIEYIKKLKDEEYKRVLLLTDYELLKDDFNGLDVVDSTKLSRAILVTSHHENHDILKRATLLNTKILPKLLAAEVKLKLKEKNIVQKENVHLVILEDNKEFSDVLLYLFEFRGKTVDIYNDSYMMLDNIDLYDKSTVKICLDFNLNQLINGVELAKALYFRGFKQLYLASGFKIDHIEIPPYLQVLSDKMELLKL